MLNVATRFSEPSDAARFVELAAKAFAHAPAHARPKDKPEFVAHTHGASNPAGRALVTLAESEGQLVGHVSALPFRFVRKDGSTLTGWQIGCYVVDASQQRMGIGKSMVADLLAGITRHAPGGFVYTYPNPRSIRSFLKLDGRELTRAPTRLVLPALRVKSPWVRDANGHRWRVELVDAAAGRALLTGRKEGEPRRGAFLRDAAFFRWRFLAPEASPRYRFARAVREDGATAFLLALAEHEVRGVSFTILVDAFPDALGPELGLAVRAARNAGGGKPVYLTSDVRWGFAPAAIAVPRRFDPRPVVGILMPGSEAIASELAAAPIVTGDWMGF